MKSLYKLSVMVIAASTAAIGNATAQEYELFLDQSRIVPPKLEWSREIVTRKGGSIYCAIQNEQGMMSVTVIADRTYQAIINKNRDGIHREDLILTIDASLGYFEDSIELPHGGSYWFIIGNGSASSSEVSIAWVEA